MYSMKPTSLVLLKVAWVVLHLVIYTPGCSLVPLQKAVCPLCSMTENKDADFEVMDWCVAQSSFMLQLAFTLLSTVTGVIFEP